MQPAKITETTRPFAVRVRTTAAKFAYEALGTDSAAVHMAAVDRFGVCAITVKPAARVKQ